MTASRGPRAVTGLWAEFWEFIKQGNVIDLAVAVVVGAAFSKIVDSLVTDIVTPALLQPALQAANVDTLSALSWNGIKYGSFLAAVLNFFIIALSIFAAIRIYEGFKHRVLRMEEEEEEVMDPAIEAQKNLTSAVERLTAVIEQKTP